MHSLDLGVLADVRAWSGAGQRVWLVTVVQTWGSAPRPPGALLALRGDGAVSGSVSGGCVEDDLIARVRSGEWATQSRPAELVYGVTQDEAARFGLPCGGTLRLVIEPVAGCDWIDELLRRTAAHKLVARRLDMASGVVTLHELARSRSASRAGADQRTDGSAGQVAAQGGATHSGLNIGLDPGLNVTPDAAPDDASNVASDAAEDFVILDGLAFDGRTLTTVFGPRWRLVLIGAGQLSVAVARMAQMLDFEVLMCDPRTEYTQGFDVPGVVALPGMPDDALIALAPDARTAVVALTHDPKLDDLALIEALRSPAFYVGALGSRRNQAVRRARLAQHFGLIEAELSRLHGPVGLSIGAKTPAEIAVSIVAEIVQIRYAPTAARQSAQVNHTAAAGPLG